MIPIFRFLFTHSKQGETFFQLQNVALELVKARRESGKKVMDNVVYYYKFYNLFYGSLRICYNL